MRKKTVNFRVAAFAVCALILGILFSYCLFIGNVAGAIVSAAVSAGVFCLFAFFSTANFKGAGRVLCLSFFIAFLTLGGASFNSAANRFENAGLDGHSFSVVCKVSEVSENEDYVCVIASDVKVSGVKNGRLRYKTALYVYGESDFRVGDILEFTAVLKDRTLIYNDKFSASSLAQGIKYFASLNSEDVAVISQSPDLFERCNLFIFDTLKSGLNDDEFSVAYAMLTGNSDYIAEENLVAYRAAGVAHIFAVSGLHIGFLATVLFFVLKKLKVNAVAAFAITLIGCAFYAGICGFSASSVRALVMFFFLNVARVLGLKYDSLSAVCAAAFVILVVNPAQLFCAGFQLSFAVVITVVISYVPLKRLLKFLPDKIASALAVSFAAEVGSAPVLLAFFGEFASLSLFVNILFIPVVGVLFITLIICTLLGGIFSPAVFLFLLNYALFGLNFIITAVDFKAFLIGGFTFGGFAAAYYGIVAVAGGLFNFNKIVKTATCIVLALVCAGGTYVRNDIKNGKIRLTVIGAENLSAALLSRDGDNLLVLSDVSYKNFPQNRLKKAVEGIDGGVSVAILTQDEKIDLVALTVRLDYVLDLNAVYYYGERDESAEKIISKAFSGFSAANMGDGDEFTVGNIGCGCALNGRCFICSFDGYNIGVFSSLSGIEDFPPLETDIDVAVCRDKQDTITKKYAPEKTVSFRAKNGYSDGETQGNLTLLLG